MQHSTQFSYTRKVNWRRQALSHYFLDNCWMAALETRNKKRQSAN